VNPKPAADGGGAEPGLYHHLGRLRCWRRLSGAVENQIVLNRGKVNGGRHALKVQGRHQGSTNPKAPASGRTENCSSFLTRAGEKNTSKRWQLVRMSGRMGQGVWRMMCFVSVPHNDVLKAGLKQTLNVFNNGGDLLPFFGRVIGERDGRCVIYW